MKHDFLILNIDKTIFDVVAPVQKAYTDLARRKGIDIPPAFLERVLDTRGSSRDRLDREFFALSKLHTDAYGLAALDIADAVADHRIFADHAETFLRFLDDRLIPYGVVSSMPRGFVNQMRERYPLFHPVFSIVQAEVFEGKPEPDLYLMAARRAGVHPNHLLVVENTHIGAESAFLANAKVIYMTDDAPAEDSAMHFCLHSADSLAELAEYLDKAWPKNSDDIGG